MDVARPAWRAASVAALIAASSIGPAAGCSGNCPDVDCADGAAVVVSFLGLDRVASAEICFDEDCAAAAMSTYSDGGNSTAALATRDLQGSAIQPGERFTLVIRAFDANGAVLAERSETRRRKDSDDCGCDGFGYRWNGESLAQW